MFEGIFCGVWKTWLILELLCVFTRQECENQGEEHYRQEREENKDFFLPNTVYFVTQGNIHKRELVFKQVTKLRVRFYQTEGGLN